MSTCLRCERTPAHGVVLVEIRDAHGGTYALCGACFVERERIEPTARKGGSPPVPIRANPARARLPEAP